MYIALYIWQSLDVDKISYMVMQRESTDLRIHMYICKYAALERNLCYL